jgi:hypothetical protein
MKDRSTLVRESTPPFLFDNPRQMFCYTEFSNYGGQIEKIRILQIPVLPPVMSRVLFYTHAILMVANWIGTSDPFEETVGEA